MAKRKRNNVFFIVGVLLFTLFLFSNMVTSGILARYTKANSNDDEARVAKFDVDVTLINDNTSSQIITLSNYQLEPGSELLIDIEFNGSNNEVAVLCEVDFEIISILPLKVYYNSYNITSSGLQTTINPKSSSNLNNISIKWNTEDNEYIYSGQVAIVNIIVTIAQID